MLHFIHYLSNQLNFIVRFLSIYAMCQKGSNSFQKMLQIFITFHFIIHPA